MKKGLFVFFILFSLLSSLGFTASININPENKAKVDMIMTIIQQQKNSESILSQITRYEKVINSFSNVNLPKGDQQDMINYLLELFKNKVSGLRELIQTQDEVITNVNRDRVGAERLSWHNEYRIKNGLDPYKLNDTLNFTALIRAQNLANTNRKSWTHSRKSGDGYYNYSSIKGRFENLGVTFDYPTTAFSESNAYQYYTCKKADCTDEMIEVLKKCFNGVLLDKTHFPAVISKTYEEIGYGVAVNGKNVRVTTHYGVNIK